MHIKSVYQLSFLLPFVVSVVCYLLALAIGDERGGDWIVILLIIAYSAYVVIIPYLTFVIGFLLWMRNKDERAIRRALLISPIVLTVIFAVIIGFSYLFLGGPGAPWEGPAGFLGAIGIFAAYAAVFGYFYVILTFVLVALLRRIIQIQSVTTVEDGR